MKSLLNRTLVILMLVAVSLPSAARERYPYGRLSFGFDSVRSFIGETQSEDVLQVDEEAVGVGINFGFMMKPNLQLRVYSAGADHPTNLEGTDLFVYGGIFELAYFIGYHPKFRPYVAGGLGGFRMESQHDNLTLESVGGALSFSVGCHYHLGRRVSLHASARGEGVPNSWSPPARKQTG